MLQWPVRLPEQLTEKTCLYSPFFDACEHRWYGTSGSVNRTTLQLLGVRQTFLDVYAPQETFAAACKHKEGDSRSKLFLLSSTKQPCPSISASFQLWLVNQQDPKKTIQKGAVKGFCQNVDSYLSMGLHLAEVQHCFAEIELDWGYFHFSQGQEVLDKTNGFVKEGRLLVGVHMSVTSPLKVPAVSSYATFQLQ